MNFSAFSLDMLAEILFQRGYFITFLSCSKEHRWQVTVLVLRKTDLCVLSLKNLTAVRFFGSLSGNRGVLGETSPNESLADKLVCLFLLHKKVGAGSGCISPLQGLGRTAPQRFAYRQQLRIAQKIL